MTLEIQPLAEITQDAFRILNKEIGTANTVRFINTFAKIVMHLENAFLSKKT